MVMNEFKHEYMDFFHGFNTVFAPSIVVFT